jgi:hypothetical protein
MSTRTPVTVEIGRQTTIVLRFWTDSIKDTEVDVSTRTFASEIRDEPGGALLATFTVDATDAADGEVRLVLDETASADLTVGRAVFDVKQVIGGVTTTLVPWRSCVIREVVTE